MTSTHLTNFINLCTSLANNRPNHIIRNKYLLRQLSPRTHHSRLNPMRLSPHRRPRNLCRPLLINLPSHPLLRPRLSHPPSSRRNTLLRHKWLFRVNPIRILWCHHARFNHAREVIVLGGTHCSVHGKRDVVYYGWFSAVLDGCVVFVAGLEVFCDSGDGEG